MTGAPLAENIAASPLASNWNAANESGRTLSQFALKRTRMTFLSYSASVCIVISTPPAA